MSELSRPRSKVGPGTVNGKHGQSSGRKRMWKQRESYRNNQLKQSTTRNLVELRKDITTASAFVEAPGPGLIAKDSSCTERNCIT